MTTEDERIDAEVARVDAGFCPKHQANVTLSSLDQNGWRECPKCGAVFEEAAYVGDLDELGKLTPSELAKRLEP